MNIPAPLHMARQLKLTGTGASSDAPVFAGQNVIKVSYRWVLRARMPIRRGRP